MALANNLAVITLVLKDTGGKTSAKEFFVPTTSWDPATGLIADLKTIRDSLVTAYNAISYALIEKSFISLSQAEDTLEFPATVCQIAEVASIVGNIDAVEKKNASIVVPAPHVDIMEGATGKQYNTVDILDAALVTFITMYETTADVFTISDGETLDDTTPLDSGKRISKRSNTQV